MHFNRSALRGDTIYAHSARFDHGHALSEDEMRRAAPSIFAVDKHHSRSDRFQPIPTIEVLRGLEKEGFSAVAVQQSTTRDLDRKDFTKHMIRLRRMNDGKTYQVNDSVFELILKNANDGTSVYDLFGGIFKVRCLNSLVALSEAIDAVKVRHTGDVQSKVIEGTYRVLDKAENILAAPQDWSRIQLSPPEQLILAEEAHTLRFADADGEVKTPISPRQLLIPRRSADDTPDLWATFNRIQEHCVVGGDTARGIGTNGRRRRFTSREVKGVDQNIKLNQGLWALAAKMAELKGAAVH